MQRYGSVIRLRPDRRAGYLRPHAAVRPAVEQMPREANIRKSTLTDPRQESLAEPGSGQWWAPMREVWHLTEESS